jgi:hypothetical protein
MSVTTLVTHLFTEHTPLEKHLRTATTILILAGVLFHSSVFEVAYPNRLVQLYAYPWWRLCLVLLVALATWWCPRVGLATALAVYLYFIDMDTLTNKVFTQSSK